MVSAPGGARPARRARTRYPSPDTRLYWLVVRAPVVLGPLVVLPQPEFRQSMRSRK